MSTKKVTPQFVMLPREVVRSDAWRSQSINARRAVDFLMLEHMAQGGRKNGQLMAPRRQLVEFGIGTHFVTAALQEVEALGLVFCTYRGIGRRSSTFALTWLPMAGGVPAMDRWRSYSNPELPLFNDCSSGETALTRPRNRGGETALARGGETALTKPVAVAKQHSQGPNQVVLISTPFIEHLTRAVDDSLDSAGAGDTSEGEAA